MVKVDSSNNQPLVSIIVPTYNRVHYIDYTIQSVLKQTYPNIELIIIDDGSTDNTREVIEQYLVGDSIIYQYQMNSGQSVARNVGLRLSSGTFICFLDSDDSLVSDAIEVMVNYMHRNKNISVVYGDLDCIDGDGNYVPRQNPTRYSGYINKQLLIDNCVSFDSVLVRKTCLESVGGLDEQVEVGDDYDLWLRISLDHEFLYVPKVFGQYRIMHHQISSDLNRRFQSNKASLERFYNKNPGIVNNSEQNYYWCRFYVRFGRDFVSRGEIGRAVRYYIKALNYKFFCIYPWRGLLKLIIQRS